MRHGSLFSGIGGFDLAAKWMHWRNVFHCEIEDFPRKVLEYHFPESISYGDIKQTDFTIHRGQIDVLTGGFPCQPFSFAGERKGTADERHLFPSMLRAVREIRPTWVVCENVYGLVGWDDGMVFEQVQTDLESEGYSVQAYVLPAAGVGAPHRRNRVWFVAHASSEKDSRRHGPVQEENGEIQKRDKRAQSSDSNTSNDVANSDSELRKHRHRQEATAKPTKEGVRAKSFSGSTQWETFPTVAAVCGGNDGLPERLDGLTVSKWRTESIKAYGNAVVPQAVLPIFKSIESYESKN